MKKKVITSLLLGLLLIVGVQDSKAQIRRNDFYASPVFQTDNFIYEFVAAFLFRTTPYIVDEDFNYVKNQWWLPESRLRWSVLQRMEFDAGKASVWPKTYKFGKDFWKDYDWDFRNYAVGYKIGVLPRISPVGFQIEADYVQDGYKVRMPWSDEKHSMIKRMISTTALAMIRILSYEDNEFNPILELGGSYDYALHYDDGMVNDKDAVNNGFTGIIGLGFTNTETHTTWSLRYEHSFYDYHNEDFKYQGTKIFSGAKSKFGRIYASLSFSL